MNDLARIRALAGLKEASSAQVITPGNDFYPPGFIPPKTPFDSHTVQVPIGWDQKGGGGGGASSAGAQGSTGSGQPTKPAEAPKTEPSAVAPSGVEVVTPDADLTDYFSKIDRQIAANQDKDKQKDSGTLPGPELELPKIQTPTTDKPVDPNYKKDDAEVIVVPPGNRPPPLDFSEPKQDMSKLPGQGGPGAENNPIVITPTKKEPEPEKTATPAPVVPVRPTPSQMFGGGIKPSKEEPPKEEPKKEPPKIAAPSAAPVAVAPTPITPPKQEEPKAEKPKIAAPSAVPAPSPQVTFPAPTPRIQVPGPTAAPAPIGTTSGSGTSSSGSGSGSSTSQGSGQGSGQGLGSGSGSGSGQGQGSGSGSGTGGGIGDKWNDHHWFQYEVGGKPAMVPPNQLPPGWKHIGNGRYVSEKPRSAYGPNERPRDPDADNRTHMQRPDWSRQLQKESTEGLDEIRRLAGIKEQVPQPSLTQAFGSGISTVQEPKQDAAVISPSSKQPAAPTEPQSQPPVQQQQTFKQQPQSQSQATVQDEPTGPEYIQRYKSGNRQPPLIFQEPSYGGPIAGPGLRGPVYRGPNPYGAFGQGRR